MQRKKITRRKFIKQTGMAGAVVAGSAILPGFNLFSQSPSISIVNGMDYFQNTIRAVQLIGGMTKFVHPGAKVGLLINSGFENHGAYVNPDITIAVIKMVRDAGASEITCLQFVKEKYWQHSSHYETHKEMITALEQIEANAFPSEFNEEDFLLITDIPGARSLPKTEVVKKWLSCDVFINIPIAKHHGTALLTAAQKNIMGVSTREVNVSFHLGSGVRNDPEYLAQCIADQNLLRKTDLCIMDATEFITDNGPAGPGTVESFHKILAGTDIVAMDALAATYVGYLPEDIPTIVKGHEMGIGNMNLEKIEIIEENAG